MTRMFPLRKKVFLWLLIKNSPFSMARRCWPVPQPLSRCWALCIRFPWEISSATPGFGYFNTAYDIYSVLLMISTAGLPVAMSRMIAEAGSLKRYGQIRRIYQTALCIFLILGVGGTVLMTGFSRPLANWMNSPNSGRPLRVGTLCSAHVLDFRVPGILPGAGRHAAHLRQPGPGGALQAGSGPGAGLVHHEAEERHGPGCPAALS